MSSLDYYGGLNKLRIVMNQTATQLFDVAALKIVADEIVLKAESKVPRRSDGLKRIMALTYAWSSGLNSRRVIWGRVNGLIRFIELSQ